MNAQLCVHAQNTGAKAPLRAGTLVCFHVYSSFEIIRTKPSVIFSQHSSV